MCPNDSFVYFRNSELISGQLGKATLGQLLVFSCNHAFIYFVAVFFFQGKYAYRIGM